MPDTPLDAYLGALDRGDMTAAADAFAENAVYIRPALSDTGAAAGFEILRGRDSILAFLTQRGKQPFRHVIKTFLDGDRRCLAEGVVEGAAVPQVFLASAAFDDDGLLTRYIAVPRAVSADELEAIERTRR